MRLHPNACSGVLTSSILAGDTTITSAGFANLPVVSGPDTVDITLDPDAVAGKPEVATVTAHTSSSTTVTVTRATQTDGGLNGSARGHASGIKWSAALTKADLTPSTPQAESLGVAGSTGTSGVAADRDHVHAMPTAASVRDSVLPPGMVVPFGGASAPAGWLLADGSVVARATYAALFAVVGTTYNTGGEAGTDFRLPNVKGRVVAGLDAGQTEFATLGLTGGEKTHALNVFELPSHTHAIDPPATVSDSQGGHSHTLGPDSFVGTNLDGGPAGLSVASGGSIHSNTTVDGAHTHTTDIAPFTSSATGLTQSHNNLQPYVTLPHIIKT